MLPEAHTINFRGDQLVALRGDDGQVFVAVKPIIEFLGLNWSTQLRRLRKDDDLGMVEMTIPTVTGDQRGICLPLPRVPALLTQIRPSKKMDEATRAKLSAYRREAFEVLWNHFSAKARPAALEMPQDFRELIRQETREAVTLALRAHLPPATLTPEQQRHVQEAVGEIVRAWSGSGLVTYQVAISRTWRALKEHFGVAKYEQIRTDRWSDVLAWLRSRKRAVSA